MRGTATHYEDGTMPELYETIYDSADEIPESIDNFRELFTEKSGKFELTGIRGIQTQANVARLEEGIRKEREATKETQARLSIWGELDHDDVIAKLDRLPELEAAAGDKLDEAGIEAIVTKRVEGTLRSKLSPLERKIAKLEKENGELATANDGFRAADTRRTIHDDLRKSLVRNKVIPEAQEDALMLGERVFEVTDAGVLTRDGLKGIPPGLDADGWLMELQSSRPHWWPDNVSGGARGGKGERGGPGGPSPWSHAGWNMTAQGQYVKLHGEEKAKRLAEASGTTLGGDRPPAKS